MNSVSIIETVLEKCELEDLLEIQPSEEDSVARLVGTKELIAKYGVRINVRFLCEASGFVLLPRDIERVRAECRSRSYLE